MREQRELVRDVKEQVEACLHHEYTGAEWHAGIAAANAHILLARFVANMGHADVISAQRMARHCLRLEPTLDKAMFDEPDEPFTGGYQ